MFKVQLRFHVFVFITSIADGKVDVTIIFLNYFPRFFVCVLLAAIGGIFFFAVNMLLLGSTLTAFQMVKDFSRRCCCTGERT